jgi:Leucine-rich repeat (LRR) protein
VSHNGGGAPFFLKIAAGTAASFLVAIVFALGLASIQHGPVATTLQEHLATLPAGERNALDALCAHAGTTPDRLKLIRVWQNEIGTTPFGIAIRGGNVCALRLSGTALADAQHSVAFPELESLWLDRNQIVALDSLVVLRKLRELNLRGNSLSTLPELPAGLEVLDAGDNQLRVIDSLSRALSLRQLYVARNQIESVEPLANLRLLAEVDLDANRISSIDPLLRVMTLRRVYVRDNPLTGATPPQTMRNGFLEIYSGR